MHIAAVNWYTETGTCSYKITSAVDLPLFKCCGKRFLHYYCNIYYDFTLDFSRLVVQHSPTLTCGLRGRVDSHVRARLVHGHSVGVSVRVGVLLLRLQRARPILQVCAYASLFFSHFMFVL